MGFFSSKKPKVAKLVMKPTTVTTGFGTGTYDPKTGKAGYTLSEPLSTARDAFYAASQEMMPSQEQKDYAGRVDAYGTSMFDDVMSRGSIQDQTQGYYNQYQNMLSGDRAREDADLANQQFSGGRMGYGQGAQGGYMNPQQYALQLARERGNQEMYFNSEDRARSGRSADLNTAFGLGDSASALRLRPYQEATGLFSTGADIEGMGMKALDATNIFAGKQFDWQKAQQENQQQINNAKASGGFWGGIGGSLLSMGINAIAGPAFSAAGSAIGGKVAGWFGGKAGPTAWGSGGFGT